MTSLIRNMLLSATLLGLFASAGTLMLAVTFDATSPRIEENRRLSVLKKLHELVSPQQHDNDLFNDVIKVSDAMLGSSTPQTVYRARLQGAPVAAIFTVIAPDGYSGNIEMLVAVNIDGSLAGVRVVSHRETPGLGDGIELRKSDWILGFSGRSLHSPESAQWAVKKDGGEFDQFTGATITPRAVVKAVHSTLLYFNRHSATLFAQDTKEVRP